MFEMSIKIKKILILKLKLTIVEAESNIVKFSTVITFLFVDLDIVDICSPVKDFEESSQKSHQILKKSQVLKSSFFSCQCSNINPAVFGHSNYFLLTWKKRRLLNLSS